MTTKLEEISKRYRHIEAEFITEWAANYQLRLEECKTRDEVTRFRDFIKIDHLPEYAHHAIQHKLERLRNANNSPD